MENLKAPFPYFGGKSKIAEEVWRRFGNVKNYVEPFFGSGAVLLRRPFPFDGTETVNDKDGMVSNFWRAVSADPKAVADHVNWPANQNDLTARHFWLVSNNKDIVSRLEADPKWYDAEAAGWWVWGLSQWIGSGFCSGNGPWSVQGEKMTRLSSSRAISRPIGINRKIPNIQAGRSKGVHAISLNIDQYGDGKSLNLYEWFDALANRMRRVRVCCTDWSKVCGGSAINLKTSGYTGIFLDPPYSEDAGRSEVYSVEDLKIAKEVRAWCIENGNDPSLRIALCGYDGEHNELEQHGWSVWQWSASGGYGSNSNARGRDNKNKERVWFSPHCLL
jgi:site-specific DNA-adenine methylase